MFLAGVCLQRGMEDWHKVDRWDTLRPFGIVSAAGEGGGLCKCFDYWWRVSAVSIYVISDIFT